MIFRESKRFSRLRANKNVEKHWFSELVMFTVIFAHSFGQTMI